MDREGPRPRGRDVDSHSHVITSRRREGRRARVEDRLAPAGLAPIGRRPGARPVRVLMARVVEVHERLDQAGHDGKREDVPGIPDPPGPAGWIVRLLDGAPIHPAAPLLGPGPELGLQYPNPPGG